LYEIVTPSWYLDLTVLTPLIAGGKLAWARGANANAKSSDSMIEATEDSDGI
jgi:hypothetical protein